LDGKNIVVGSNASMGGGIFNAQQSLLMSPYLFFFLKIGLFRAMPKDKGIRVPMKQ
jgi:hypothetical protein